MAKSFIQEINFYTDAYKPVKTPKILKAYVFLLTVISGLLLAIAAYFIMNNYKLESKHKNLELKITENNQRIEALNKAISLQKLNPILSAEQTSLEASILTIENTIKDIKRLDDYSSVNYHAVINDISNIKQQGLWLNKIVLMNDSMELQGSIVKSSEITNYIESIKTNNHLKHLKFEKIDVQSVDKKHWDKFVLKGSMEK